MTPEQQKEILDDVERAIDTVWNPEKWKTQPDIDPRILEHNLRVMEETQKQGSTVTGRIVGVDFGGAKSVAVVQRNGVIDAFYTHYLNCRRCSDAMKTKYLLTDGMSNTVTPEQQRNHERRERAKAMCRIGRRLAKRAGHA